MLDQPQRRTLNSRLFLPKASGSLGSKLKLEPYSWKIRFRGTSLSIIHQAVGEQDVRQHRRVALGASVGLEPGLPSVSHPFLPVHRSLPLPRSLAQGIADDVAETMFRGL